MKKLKDIIAMDNQNQLQVLWKVNFRRRKASEVSKMDFFHKMPFFETLTPKQLKTLSRFMHERRYEENEFLFEVNHPGAALFLISRGEVAIELKRESTKPESIATIKTGEFLGEMALLDDSPRSATARATKPTVAFALSRAELNRLAKEDPVIAMEIYKALAWVISERLKSQNRFVDIKGKSAA